MKKIIILLLFLLNIFIVFANDKIDYSKYYLQGFFKLGECFLNEKKEETCEKQYFNIYDNKIIIISKINKQENYKAIKNDKYELITNEGSKIKIQVKDCYIEKFDLLSDELIFKRSEKEIGYNKNCYIAYQEIIFNIANKINQKIYTIGKIVKYLDNNRNNWLINKSIIYIKYKDILISALFNDINNSIILFSSGKINFKINNLNKEIEVIREYEEGNLKIENCVITYYNKDKEIFTIQE